MLYLGGYLLMSEVRPDELRAVFAAARRAGAKTVLDVVTPGRPTTCPRLEAVLPEVDVFLPNNHEAELITGERDPLAQAETFHASGGEDGHRDAGRRRLGAGRRKVSGLRAGAFPVPFVDGSGGGDAFAAGYIDGLLRGLDAEGCLRRASAVGASCVRAIGTTTSVFTGEECEAFLRENMLRIEEM